MLKKVGIILSIVALSSCSYLQGNQSDTHKALCGQIKNRMLMNGSTPNPRAARVQKADFGNLAKTYRANGCE